MPNRTDDLVDRIRAQWGIEMPSLDTSALDLTHRITMLASRLDREAQTVLAELSLTASTFDLLSALYVSGPAHRSSPTQLSAGRMMSSGGVTARLDAAERQGLVERLRTPADRRAVPVRLTSRGARVVRRAASALIERQRRFKTALTKEQQLQLISALTTLIGDSPAAGSAANRALLQDWLAAFGRKDGWTVGLLGTIPLVSKQIDAASTRVVGPSGLTPNGFGLLCALRRAGKPFRLKPSELYGIVALSPAGVAGQLDSLETARLITRSNDDADRRTRHALLSPAGKQCVESLIVPFVEAHRAIAARLTPHERTVTVRLLRQLSES